MIHFSKKIKWLALAILVFIIVTAILFIPFWKSLVFYQENTDDIAAFLPIDEGDTFQLIWTHSIHLTDVVEKYEITENRDIKQYEIVYENFGIGMPSNALEGETFEYENGKYYIKNLKNIFPAIKWRNGKTVSRNRLVWGKEDENMIWFNEFFQPGAWFTIKVQSLSLWQRLRGVKIHE